MCDVISDRLGSAPKKISDSIGIGLGWLGLGLGLGIGLGLGLISVMHLLDVSNSVGIGLLGEGE